MNDDSTHPEQQGGFHGALDSLTRAGVGFQLRKATRGAPLPMEGELDIWLDPRAVAAADTALARATFHRFRAPGQGCHRFYLSFQDGHWLKLDAKLGGGGRRGPDRADFLGPRKRIRAGLARRRFAGLRRLGPVVAVLGPDGAGKSSVIAGLQSSIPVAVTALYLGRRGARGQPATGQRHPTHTSKSPRSRAGRARETAFVLRKAIRSWTTLLPGYLAAWRGHIVLCDRHPIEVLAVRPERTQPAGAVERIIASHLMPRPDAMILLDAPEDILVQRKAEHSTEVLERWRRSYAQVFVPLGATIVPTTGPPKAAVAQAANVVWEALCLRRAW